MSTKNKNPQTAKQQYDAVVNSINQTQLKSSANKIPVEKTLDDSPVEFVEKMEPDNRDISIDSFPEFAPFPETNRFAKRIKPQKIEKE